MALDVSKNAALTHLECKSERGKEAWWESLKALDVSNNNKLIYLDCSDNSSLSNLDVSKNNALTSLRCSSNNLWNNLDVSKNVALTYLDCSYNRLTALDVSNNTALTELICTGQRTQVYLRYAGDNSYPYFVDLSELLSVDVSRVLSVDAGVLSKDKILLLPEMASAPTYYYDTGFADVSMDVFIDFYASMLVHINKNIFPDDNFRAYVNRVIDTDGDGCVRTYDPAVTSIDVSGMEITSLKGIEYFTA